MNEGIFLALGSNLGNKAENFILTVKKLEENGVKFIKSSPVYRTPSLLLKGSPSKWNMVFLNAIIKVETSLSPLGLLNICKKVEKELERDFSKKWTPRSIDIDILFYNNEKINSDILTIPHKDAFNRYFLLDEMSFICPEKLKNINYYGTLHQAVFMGILNVTPDSFSDGNIYNKENNFIKTFEEWEKEFVPIIDIGAESTNPNSKAITSEEEIERLKFVFEYLKNKKFGYFRPILSIDTYHPNTAKIAIENGFNIVNDVSGLASEEMLDLAKNNRNIKFVINHNLTIPANKNIVISDEKNVLEEVDKWFENKLNIIEKNNIDRNQIIFDFGLGFGKTASQSLQLLQNIEYFYKYGVKILVGHSRKSFMNIFNENKDFRDFETIAMSMGLANKVDILRVHTPIEHQIALQAFSHLNNQFV